MNDRVLVWKVPKKELEDALDLLLSVPARNGIPSSEYIQVNHFDGNTAVCYLSSDLSGCVFINGSRKYPFKKPFYLDRRLFDPFVGQGKESRITEYTFRMKGTRLIVKHGVRTIVCNVARSDSGYHTVPYYKNAKKMIIDEALAAMLKAATACATGDPVSAHLNAVYTLPFKKGVKLYSSNTSIIFRAKVFMKHPPSCPIAFPLPLTELITDHEMPEVLWDEGSATLSSPRGKLWSAVVQAARDKFPIATIDERMKECREGKLLFSVDADSLSVSAGRLSSYLSAVTREDLVLKMITKKGSRKMKLRAGTGNTRFTEQLTLSKVAEADNVVHWPLAEVLPVLVFSKDHGDAKLYRSKEGLTFYTTKKIELVVARLSRKLEKGK